ncbi:similar to Saccharomyces cerevisiae YJL127C-B Putative protein of unknown function [Maudiozyma barnettii]|uniref:Uncharacterized protein n=1 Tax=Maudiozyma barnettii TaxID=61262 RepID=A0A8H2VGR8_9SACH|nr:Mco6p [Kazachstania barnettii]CAB4255141.1 similar to Saccharomyces cerevisiae YJL127C-B Putative protein of unknown function [Kazachstania barnettii]CAD1783412.1 similar to Saccharomyces cerevisiae YJL127C-B Putative protein of unknown function [Kazachstania barnettii]
MGITLIFKQIRGIFAQSHSKSEQVRLSRRAFFQLLGYLGGCVIISLATQSQYLE